MTSSAVPFVIAPLAVPLVGVLPVAHPRRLAYGLTIAPPCSQRGLWGHEHQLGMIIIDSVS
jgi:hypothetical protein